MKDRADPLVSIAAGLWIALAVVLSIVVVARNPHRQSVYPAFSTAARAWRAGETIYQPGGQGYRYAPVVAPGLIPLSLLPDRVGGLLWRWINGIALVGGLWACRRVGVPRVWTAPGWAAVFLLVFPDAVANLNNGQPNALVLGLMLLAVAAVDRERWQVASACLAAATLLKVYPAALAGVLIVLYPRQLGWRYALWLAAGLAAPLGLQRFDYVREQYRLWFEYVWGENRQIAALDHWYRDIRLPLKVWFDVDLSQRVYRGIEAVAGVAIAVGCWWMKRRGAERRWLLGLAVGWTTWWMTLLGPATETVTYLILAPALAWAMVESFTRPVAPWRRVVIVAAFSLMLSVHVSGWFGGRAYLTLGPSALAAMLYGVWMGGERRGNGCKL